MRICVTGASGFIGRSLVGVLADHGETVLAMSRRAPLLSEQRENVCWLQRDLEAEQTTPKDLLGVRAVVHLAGRAHVTDERSDDPEVAYRRANVDAAVRLARIASQSGVAQFVFVSSISVYLKTLERGVSVNDDSPTDPVGLYACSKREAELALAEIARKESMALTILRPALVVGPGAPGNLKRLASLLRTGIPMPVPAGGNARAYVGCRNLCQLISECIHSPASAGQTFIAAEEEPVSTEQVMKWIAEGMGMRARTVKVPRGLLRGAALLAGQKNVYEKLYGDAKVDARKARMVLNWRSIQSLEDAFKDFGRAERAGLTTN